MKLNLYVVLGIPFKGAAHQLLTLKNHFPSSIKLCLPNVYFHLTGFI